MRQETIDKKIEDHRKWIFGEGGERAQFLDANLRGKDFRNRFLNRARFWRSKLNYANFNGACLSCADFGGADLRNASFTGASLLTVNFTGADLRGANFRGADLSQADFTGARLDHADLRGARILWAGIPLSLDEDSANFDDDQLKQIAYKLVKDGLKSKNASKETKAELGKLIDFANGFHLADHFGKIEKDWTGR